MTDPADVARGIQALPFVCLRLLRIPSIGARQDLAARLCTARAERVRIRAVRWERLFADLQAQLDAADAAELEAEVVDRTRRELATVALLDRLRAARGGDVTIETRSGVVRGNLARCGADWVLLAEQGRDLLVPMSAVVTVRGLPSFALGGDVDLVRSRLGLGYVLRVLARDRVPVSVGLVGGSGATGTVDRVGADHFELAEHDPAQPRREADVRGVRTVPFAAVDVVRSA
jgi:hypothetical protein